MNDVALADDVRAALVNLLPSSITSAVQLVAEQSVVFAEEMSHLKDATVHRRNEFATGRHCLRAALHAQGEFCEALPRDSDGVPRVPVGYLGSLSHSRGLCAAVAAPVGKCAYLGLDVEKTTRLSLAATQRVVHAKEVAWVDSDQRKASVLFSMKEAFYKAQFVDWRSTGNFHDLALEVDEVNQSAQAVYISKHFPAKLAEHVQHFQFRYRFVDSYVISLCFSS